MTPLVWVAVPVAAYIAVAGVVENFNLDVSNLVMFGIAPLVLILPPCRLSGRHGKSPTGPRGGRDSPSGSRARTAARTATRHAGRRTGRLNLAAGLPISSTAAMPTPTKRPVDVVGRDPGRVVTGLDPAGDAVLVYDERLRHEPQLVKSPSM